MKSLEENSPESTTWYVLGMQSLQVQKLNALRMCNIVPQGPSSGTPSRLSRVLEWKVFLSLGRQFNKEGNLAKWWSNKSIEAFKNKTACLVKQYSGYKFHGKNVSLEFTQKLSTCPSLYVGYSNNEGNVREKNKESGLQLRLEKKIVIDCVLKLSW